MRADAYLVHSGHAATRSQAQRLIAQGLHWRLTPSMPWQQVTKNGDTIPAGAELQLSDASEAQYVSRGGLKLAGALRDSGWQVRGLRCLDVGQSTGGFTDCLLQAGAVQVIGVDVGQGQLHPRLLADPRVVAVQGLNARHLSAESLEQACEQAISQPIEADPDDNDTQPQAPYAWMRNGGLIEDDYDEASGDGHNDAREHEVEAFKAERAAKARARAEGRIATRLQRLPGREHDNLTPQFDGIVGDVSFISLTLVLPALVPLLAPHGRLLMLVKPQFELQPGQVGKGGVVRDAQLYPLVEQRLRACCQELGLEVQGWYDSAIAGGDGNREFFVDARKPA